MTEQRMQTWWRVSDGVEWRCWSTNSITDDQSVWSHFYMRVPSEMNNERYWRVTHFFCSFLFFSAGPPSLPSVMASGEPLPSGVPAGADRHKHKQISWWTHLFADEWMINLFVEVQQHCGLVQSLLFWRFLKKTSQKDQALRERRWRTSVSTLCVFPWFNHGTY